MSLFSENKDFYPTPSSVIAKMVEPFRTGGCRTGFRGSDLYTMEILEPSAGKGNILDYLKETCFVKTRSLYAIEQDPDLVHILQSKGYKVIANDFLEYKPDYAIDLIIANPPYSNGEDHILHMWNILHSGHIICLLNSETVLNPFSQKRQLLAKIIQDNGSVEHIGKVFQDAERRTAVESCIVRLSKKSESKFDFKFENVTKETEHDFSEEIAGNNLAINDLTGNLIRCYDKTKDAFVKYIQARKELAYYSEAILPKTRNIDSITDQAFKDSGEDTARYNSFLDQIKLSAWQNILSKLNIEKYLTNSVLNNFQEFAKNQGALDLTKENIHELIMMIVGNRDQIMKQAVIDVFDLFTKYHQVNRIHPEGWKTNEAWIVGSKIILPRYIEMGYHGYFSVNYNYSQEFRDIEKVMCYISGIDYNELNQPLGSEKYGTPDREKKFVKLGLEQAIRRVKIGDTGWSDSEFFQLRCYKKGTIHIKFKSEELRAKFNQIACLGKFNLGYQTKRRKAA